MYRFGCSGPGAPEEAIVLDYRDFGPPAMSYEVLGYSWWQWDSHGDSDPSTRYDIKVVVYRGLSLDDVKSVYPVNRQKKQDYRYIEAGAAIQYLDEKLKELVDWQESDPDTYPAELTARLLKTRQEIRTLLMGGGRGE